MSDQAFDHAKQIFDRLPGEPSLAAAVAVLARNGVSENKIVAWANDQARIYGVPFADRRAFDLCIARGLRLAEPKPSPAQEPEVEQEPSTIRWPSRTAIPQPVALDDSTLLALATDPASTKRRLQSLRRETSKLANLQRAIATERAEVDAIKHRAEADLAAREEKLRDEKRELTRREYELASSQSETKRWREAYERITGRLEDVGPAGGVTRSYVA